VVESLPLSAVGHGGPLSLLTVFDCLDGDCTTCCGFVRQAMELGGCSRDKHN